MTRTYTRAPELTTRERDELLESMENEELRQGILAGTYYISGPGHIPSRPVVRWVDGPRKGQPVIGSGSPPQGEKTAEMNRKSAWKRTAAYRELLDRYWAPELEWLFEQAKAMIEGGPVNVKAVCPECEHRFNVEAYRKGDAQALKVVWESIIGRASERKEVDVNIRALMAQIDERSPLSTIEVIEVSPEEVAQRIALSEGRRALDAD